MSFESACLRALPGASGALLAALTLLAPALAQAQSDSDLETARAVFVEASKLAVQGRWDEARERYRLSLRLRRAAITFYRLGVVDKDLGRLVEAREAFRAFLAEPSTPATAGYEEPARSAITELDSALAAARLEDAATPPPVEPTPPPVAAPAPIAAVAPPVAAPNRTVPLALIGTGSAVFIAGVVTGLIGLEQASNATSPMGSVAESARTKGFIGDVLAGAGLAAAGAGLVVLLVQKSPAPAKASSIRPWFAGTSAGVRLEF